MTLGKIFYWVLIGDINLRVDFRISFMILLKRELTWESLLVGMSKVDKIGWGHLLMEFLWIVAVIALFFGFDFDGHESMLGLEIFKKIASANFAALLILCFRNPLIDKYIILAFESNVIFGFELFEEFLSFKSIGFF